MSQVTPEAVLEALRQVVDPDLGRDIVSLGFVTRNVVTDGAVQVTINLTTPACPMKERMREDAVARIRGLEGVEEVSIEMTAVPVHNGAPAKDVAPGVRNFIAISSGKGGVGKSTVAVNLAVALARRGARVGILDSDAYGPDIPMMMGLEGRPAQEGRVLIPKERHGVKTMSVGYLLDPEQPVMWRGPMLHKFIEQCLGMVAWGELDYLLIDMPPGTGDVQMSLAKIVELTGAVLVTTPQAVSAFDVGKAIAMFREVEVPILGLVENMSSYLVEGQLEGGSLPERVSLRLGGEEQVVAVDAEGRFRAEARVFGAGGAERLARQHGLEVLGQIPLEPAVRSGGDAGNPVTVAAPDSRLAAIFDQLAGKLAQRAAMRQFAELPVLQ